GLRPPSVIILLYQGDSAYNLTSISKRFYFEEIRGDTVERFSAGLESDRRDVYVPRRLKRRGHPFRNLRA
ncbi:MAG: hypothetical protein ACK4Z9_04090, partial [Thermodesulfovibrionales bacterium]